METQKPGEDSQNKGNTKEFCGFIVLQEHLGSIPDSQERQSILYLNKAKTVYRKIDPLLPMLVWSIWPDVSPVLFHFNGSRLRLRT